MPSPSQTLRSRDDHEVWARSDEGEGIGDGEAQGTQTAEDPSQARMGQWVTEEAMWSLGTVSVP